MANLGANLLSPSLHYTCVAFGIGGGDGNKSLKKHCLSFANECILIVFTYFL